MSERGTTFDLGIFAGGITGCGIARDAAGRGLKVILLSGRDAYECGAAVSMRTEAIGFRRAADQWSVRTADGTAWCRTKLGVKLTPDDMRRLGAFMARSATQGTEEAIPS